MSRRAMPTGAPGDADSPKEPGVSGGSDRKLRVVGGGAESHSATVLTDDAMPCVATPEGLFWSKQTADGPVTTQLTNFGARIVAQIERDDGVETRRAFEIEAECRGRSRTFTLPAEQFQGMNWATEQLGAGAIVYPGVAARDRARAAIQFLSGDPPTRTVFTHTGWTELAGFWCYLHAGGAIGAEGPVSGVAVDVPRPLHGVNLPSPPGCEELRRAVATSLRIESLAPGRITWPLLAATYRSVLGPCDFAVHLAGRTGTGKTELAALMQQHFGAALDARSLPAAWSSTGNALETLAFYAKDALLVVDDFAPGGTSQDVARIHQQAERFLRGQGNASGRGRLAPDGSLRSVRPPRGLTLSTGEDVPRGQSLRARMLVLEVEPGDLNWSALSGLQLAAREGSLASAMAGYLQWLSPMFEEMRVELSDGVESLRSGSSGQGHRRASTTEANLIIALQNFLIFAHEIGALGEESSQEIERRAIEGILAATAAQVPHQVDADPVLRFLEMLPAALSSGVAHVVTANGGVPEPAAPWGWRRRAHGGSESPGGEWQPQGIKIGWLEGDDLYLDQQAAYRAAQGVIGGAGEVIPVSVRTLARRLNERGLLRSIDATGSRLTVRRNLEGTRRHVLHLASSTVNEQQDFLSADPAGPLR